MIRKKRLVAQISAATDIGNKRETNQDNLYIMKPILDFSQLEHFSSSELCGVPLLVAVCDGMGGGMLGERASYMAVSYLESINLEYLQSLKTDALIENLKGTFWGITRDIYEEYGILGTLTGCTLTLIYIDNKRIAVLNVGDSPCFRFDDKGCQLLTRIDNKASIMYEMGQISEQERWVHKTKNQLSQYLGINPQDCRVEPHVYLEKHIKKNVVYLLCTDGLTDSLNGEELHHLLFGGFRPDIAQRVVEKALCNGSRDNVTAVVVKVDKSSY